MQSVEFHISWVEWYIYIFPGNSLPIIRFCTPKFFFKPPNTDNISI